MVDIVTGLGDCVADTWSQPKNSPLMFMHAIRS